MSVQEKNKFSSQQQILDMGAKLQATSWEEFTRSVSKNNIFFWINNNKKIYTTKQWDRPLQLLEVSPRPQHESSWSHKMWALLDIQWMVPPKHFSSPPQFLSPQQSGTCSIFFVEQKQVLRILDLYHGLVILQIRPWTYNLCSLTLDEPWAMAIGSWTSDPEL